MLSLSLAPAGGFLQSDTVAGSLYLVLCRWLARCVGGKQLLTVISRLNICMCWQGLPSCCGIAAFLCKGYILQSTRSSYFPVHQCMQGVAKRFSSRYYCWVFPCPLLPWLIMLAPPDSLALKLRFHLMVREIGHTLSSDKDMQETYSQYLRRLSHVSSFAVLR